MPESKYRFATRAIHSGQEPDPATGAIITPIYQTSTFVQSDVGEHKCFDYARTDNPTRSALQECLADLEGAQYALAFASGMAAIATTMYLLKQGDHIVAGDDAYGGTYRLFSRVLSNFGLEFTFADLTALDKTRAALRPATRMIWLESPTNPLLKVIDIAGIGRLAAERAGTHARDQARAREPEPRPLVVVDNTFASPYLQQPL